MTQVTWLPRAIVMGVPVPHQFGANELGQQFALVRERADRRSWRVSVFPDGNPDHSFEAVAGSERQAKRWIERWAAKRVVNCSPLLRGRVVQEEDLKPRRPKGLEDRS